MGQQLIIRWSVQQTQESTSDRKIERERESENKTESALRLRVELLTISRNHHHQSELLTCHGTAMIIRWTGRSRDFYKCVSEREQDRVSAKIKRETEREFVYDGRR